MESAAGAGFYLLRFCCFHCHKNMKFKVKEGLTKDGIKYVKTISEERGEHEIVNQSDLDAAELSQDDSRVMKALEIMLEAYRGKCE